MNDLKGRRWHFALILLLGLLGYGHLLVPGDTLYSPHSDFVAWGMASKQVLYRALHEGLGIPFWRSDQLAGYAALSNPNSLYTYPLHALFLFLPAVTAAGPTAFLHFVLSGIGFYALGCVLELRASARLLMAAAGLFSFKLILATYAGFLFMPSAALLSGLFAAFLYAWKRPGLGSASWFCLLSYLCLNGHPQIFLYALGTMGIWSIVWCIARAREGSAGEGARSLASLCAGGLLALGLMAHALLPLIDETSLVTRGERGYEAHLAEHSVGARHLSMLLFPEALGTPLDHSYPTDELWEDEMYFGLLPLLLTVCGLWLCRRRPLAVGFAASLGVTLLLACDTPILRFAFEHVPGFNYLRHPGRILFMAPVFGIGLAGMGIDALTRRMRSARAATWLAAAAIACICLEGGFYARRYVTTRPANEAFPVPQYAKAMAADGGVYRVAPTSRAALSYGWAAGLGLQLITGYDHINYRHFQIYMDVLRRGAPGPARAVGWYDLDKVTRWDLLDALNAKYLVSRERLTAPEGRLRELQHWPSVSSFYFFYGLRDAPAFLYENLHARARAYFVDSVTRVDARSELAELARADLTRVAIESDPAASGVTSEPEPRSAASVESVRSRDGRLELTTRTSAPRFLVISEIWHPGWRAFVDEQPLPLVRTNVALLGARVPAGQHRITLVFEPPSWKLGLGISGVAGACWLLLLLALVRQRAARR